MEEEVQQSGGANLVWRSDVQERRHSTRCGHVFRKTRLDEMLGGWMCLSWAEAGCEVTQSSGTSVCLRFTFADTIYLTKSAHSSCSIHIQHRDLETLSKKDCSEASDIADTDRGNCEVTLHGECKCIHTLAAQRWQGLSSQTVNTRLSWLKCSDCIYLSVCLSAHDGFQSGRLMSKQCITKHHRHHHHHQLLCHYPGRPNDTLHLLVSRNANILGSARVHCHSRVNPRHCLFVNWTSIRLLEHRLTLHVR